MNVVVSDDFEDALESLASELVRCHVGQDVVWSDECLDLTLRTDGECDTRR